MARRSRQVFISYQRSDHAFARDVREHLAAAGVTTWMDQFDIAVGAYWTDEIDKGLAASDIVVGVLSPDAVESRNVKNEWDWAIQNDKPLLLLQYRPCVVPHRYVSINFIDATGADPSGAFDALLGTLGVAPVGAGSRDASQAATPPPVYHGGRTTIRRRRPEPVLVGREREQQDLRHILGEVLEWGGALVLVGGEAGAGKTMLTSWLAWLAEENSALALTGGCYDLSTPRPYQPWAEIIWNWPADPQQPLPPDDLRSDEGFTTVRSQATLIDVVATFLADSSAHRPLMLLLEDLQWADQASMDLLRALTRLIDGQRVLLVATYRDDEITRRHPLYSLLPGLSREPNTHRVDLGRLPPDETRRLVAERYALPESDLSRLASYVHTLAEGNPFFSSEVLRELEASGAIVQDGDEWQLAQLEQAQVPPLVRQVIDARLAHLNEEARGLLQVAAVIGHDVPVEVWAAITAASDDALASAMEQAIEGNIVEEQRNGTHMRFTHALIRETLYEGLVSIRRRTWHRKVAEALAAESRPDPDAVAHHFRQAGDERAYAWLVRAGERSERSFAWSMAAERFEAALELLGDRPETLAERGRLLYRVGYLLRYTADPRVVDFNAEALTIARQTGDRALEALALFQSGTPRLTPGDLQAADARMRAAVQVFDELTSDER
ncbi:MAG TPA: TIR domain-containing protein, partial [Thermomicrobiales bacterium]|nr:TIR domain-containing protein [Thermomicrobiales bacterium]